MVIGVGLGIPFGNVPFTFAAGEAPTLLTATSFSDTQVDLAWSDNSSNEGGYSIERSTDGVTYAEIDTVLANIEIYSDTTFAEPAILYYRVRAFKLAQYSNYSNVAIVYPEGVRISSADTSILLADATNEFYFSSGGVDSAFSVLIIAKLNDLTQINRLFCRGNALGTSYVMGYEPTNHTMDFAIYGSDLIVNNVLYKKASNNYLNDTNIHRLAYTYSGNELPTGMKLYKDGVLPGSYLDSQKYGTYNSMNNRPGIYVGNHIQGGYVSKADIFTLIVCNKELSQAEVTEFQNMSGEDDIDTLSFYANIKTINRFAGVLTDDLGVHNGSSVDPAFFFMNNHIEMEWGRTVYPSLVKTTFQDTFEDFKLGWFICYAMVTYNEDETDGKTLPTSAPSVFTAPSNVDVAAWATLANSYGKIDYAILTTNSIYGFSLYDHQTAQWRGTQIDVGGGIIVPTYTKYDVGSSGCNADKNIVPKFVTEFNAVGIKPILYYCVGWSRNWCGQQWPNVTYLNPDYQFAKYHDYVRERLQELARLTPFAMWIDIEIYYPAGYTWDLYNAIKAINPEIGVKVNCWGNFDNSDNSFGAFDGAAAEEAVKPALPGDPWWALTQTYGGVTYPVVKELVFTSRVTNKWYWKTDPWALRPLSELQDEYDYAKLAGVPCAVSINPKDDGVIDQDQADLVGSIVL